MQELWIPARHRLVKDDDSRCIPWSFGGRNKSCSVGRRPPESRELKPFRRASP